MADTMQFDLVSPEARLASYAVTSVSVPGAEGDMTVMAGHAPVISTLRPGVISCEGGEGGAYIVTGGFVEITEAGISVLAERAFDKASASKEALEALLADAREAASSATAEQKDAAEMYAAELEAIVASVA